MPEKIASTNGPLQSLGEGELECREKAVYESRHIACITEINPDRKLRPQIATSMTSACVDGKC